MATDRYVNPVAEAGEKPYPSNQVSGAKTISMAVSFEKTAQDGNSSVLRLFKSLPATLVPLSIKIMNDALAGATAVKLGMYKPEKGVKISEDALAAALDISSAHGANGGLEALTFDVVNVGKTLGEILNAKLSNNEMYDTVDICLTGTTFGTAAGTISVIATFLQA